MGGETYEIGDPLDAVLEALVWALVDVRPRLAALTFHLFLGVRQGDVDGVCYQHGPIAGLTKRD